MPTNDIPDITITGKDLANLIAYKAGRIKGGKNRMKNLNKDEKSAWGRKMVEARKQKKLDSLTTS